MDERVRVLYVSQGYTPHDYRFLSGLASSGHEVFHLRFNAAACSETRPLPAGVGPVDWKANRPRPRVWNVPFLARRLASVLARIRPDLVHAGPIQQGAALAALSGFRPIVAMSWGSDLLIEGASGLGRLIARYALQRSAALLCDCQAVRMAAERLGFASDRIVVFPWGVDLVHFRPGDDAGLRARLGWSDGIVVLSTRSWESAYGIPELVEGFIQAGADIPQLRLLMLGGGSLGDTMQRRLKAAGMMNRVHLAGWVSYQELPHYYCAADIYVSASHADGSSVSLLEAMACGLPAIASNIPGNQEWVSPGVTGWLFPVGSAAHLAEAIRQAVEGQTQWSALGARARQQAVERADWARNFPRIHEAYRMALMARGTSARS